MTDLFEFLRQEGINGDLLKRAADFRREFPLTEADASRVPKPRFLYYGKDVWEKALTAILSGENILLCGTKATGKNVLAENLSALLSRPEWDISFYLNTDAATLRDGKVTFRRGPIYQCAEHGGFGILDEINMAKNESLAVLHATLDFRRIIDVPGYERITLSPCTRFIATMNYGYAGTRELNEALASRFVVINMPVISKENLTRLLLSQYPELKGTYAEQLANVEDACRCLLPLLEQGCSLVIGHGNGPQVGNALLRHEAGSSQFGLQAMPMDFCGAETQGSITYLIETAMEKVLKSAGMSRSVVSLVTRVEVSAKDPAFAAPSKPVGPY